MGITTNRSVSISSVSEAIGRIGQSLGTTAWVSVTQELVNQFAQVTGDEQWIHIDPDRAIAGPFGGCIAHGHLTLSLAGGKFFHELVHATAERAINYGCDKVRFLTPVLVGSRIRGNAMVVEGHKVADRGVHLMVRMTVEIENQGRPACVADLLARYFFKD